MYWILNLAGLTMDQRHQAALVVGARVAELAGAAGGQVSHLNQLLGLAPQQAQIAFRLVEW